jgi:Rnl2 family RNA ligase
MEFKKYSSIENSYRERYIEKVRETLNFLGCPDMLFSVSEKVDGCNTSVITDGKGIITGKRGSVLTADDKFYGFQDFAETSLKGGAVSIMNTIKREMDIKQIQVFGEFFGGGYDGYKSNVPKIQKGIQYCPDHEFYAFDILVSNGEKDIYLGVDECNKLFEEFGFFYNKELFRGTLDECLAYNPIFISTIGERLGYPRLENNYAEGVVIKPITDLRFANGERIIIKNKNPKFNEFEKSDKKEKPQVELSDTCINLMNEIGNYVTEARLGNVMSHLGELDMPKQMGLLMKEYSADTIEEFLKDHPEYNEMPSQEQKIVNKTLNKLAVEIIKRKL